MRQPTKAISYAVTGSVRITIWCIDYLQYHLKINLAFHDLKNLAFQSKRAIDLNSFFLKVDHMYRYNGKIS